MTLRQLCNAAYAALTEGLDDEGCLRMDRAMLGETLPAETAEEAMVRAHQRTPRRGAPVDFTREQKTVVASDGRTPPPMPAGYKLAPVGVQVREPEPTRGLAVLDAALGVAPPPNRARPAVRKRG